MKCTGDHFDAHTKGYLSYGLTPCGPPLTVRHCDQLEFIPLLRLIETNSLLRYSYLCMHY